MDEFQMCYAMWKKPDAKSHMLYNFISMTFWKRKIYQYGEQMVARDWGQKRRVDWRRQHKGSFEVTQVSCIMTLKLHAFIKPTDLQHKEWILLCKNLKVNFK